MQATSCVSQQSGTVDDGFCVSFSGDVSGVAECRCLPLPVSRPAVAEVESCSRWHAFSIAPLPVDDYFGFAVSGANRRFLLADFTVTHNVSLSSAQLSSASEPAPPPR